MNFKDHETPSHLLDKTQRNSKKASDSKTGLIKAKDNNCANSEFLKELRVTNRTLIEKEPKMDVQLEENKYAQSIGDDFRVDEIEEEAQFDFPLSPKNKRKMKRWDKNQDKKLFAAIRALEKQGVIQLEDILMLDPKILSNRDKRVNSLEVKVEWKTGYKKLIERIQKLSCKKFSFREVKALKKILKNEYCNKPIDYDKILYHFPGKTMEKLIQTCNYITDCITTKSMATFMNET